MDYRKNNLSKRFNLLSESEIEAFELSHPDGLSSAEIVEIFVNQGLRFSEATFRKYVQQGLLPRSRRVGQKGKHKGSRGVYPVGTIRQINEIKRMMAQDLTIEEIRQQFAFVGGELEELQRLLQRIFDKFDGSSSERDEANLAQVSVYRQIDEAKQSAGALVGQLEKVASNIRVNAQVARSAV